MFILARKEEEEYYSADFSKTPELDPPLFELHTHVSNDAIQYFYDCFRIAAQEGNLSVPRKSMSSGRRKNIANLLANFSDEDIAACFDSISKSNQWAQQQSFFAIDWIITPENFQKVAEGKFAIRQAVDPNGPCKKHGEDGRFQSSLPGYGSEPLHGDD